METVGSLPESELPQNRALKINPGYSATNHSLGGGDLSQAFSLAHVGPLVSGTFPKLADITIPKKVDRSEEHTYELQSLMRTSYAVFCLKKKKKKLTPHVH